MALQTTLRRRGRPPLYGDGAMADFITVSLSKTDLGPAERIARARGHLRTDGTGNRSGLFREAIEVAAPVLAAAEISQLIRLTEVGWCLAEARTTADLPATLCATIEAVEHLSHDLARNLPTNLTVGALRTSGEILPLVLRLSDPEHAEPGPQAVDINVRAPRGLKIRLTAIAAAADQKPAHALAGLAFGRPLVAPVDVRMFGLLGRIGGLAKHVMASSGREPDLTRLLLNRVMSARALLSPVLPALDPSRKVPCRGARR